MDDETVVGVVEISVSDGEQEAPIIIKAESLKRIESDAKTFNKIIFTHSDAEAHKRIGKLFPKNSSLNVAQLRLGAVFTPTFCGDDHSYAVFRKELDFIRSRRQKMGLHCLWRKDVDVHSFKNAKIKEVREITAAADKGRPQKRQWSVTLSFEDTACEPKIKEKLHPTTENQLVGLCLSGGGIRSATFNLGFLQALFHNGLLRRVDYLSTVSGGGYIGSCMTALLSSDVKTSQNQDKNPGMLWAKGAFPFARPIQQNPKKKEPGDAPGIEGLSCEKPKGVPAEKKPVGHLRYYSNYLTAEGNLIQKYVGPVTAMARGLLFNSLLIAPIIILAAVILAALYKIPPYRIGPFPLFFHMQTMKDALSDFDQRTNAYERFVLASSKDLEGFSFSERVNIISADPALNEQEEKLKQQASEASETIRCQWLAMITAPVVAVGVMMLLAFLFMQWDLSALRQRFKFSYVMACIVFGASVLFFIQLFGAAILYWNHHRIPNQIALISLLSVLGPRILKSLTKAKEGGGTPWVRIGLSFGLMALAPMILLFFTGCLVHALWNYNPSDFSTWYAPGYMKWAAPTAIGILLWAVTNRCLNINRISLHEFYRDRLCRAFLIQHDNPKGQSTADPFDEVKPNDRIRLSEIYEAENTTGPYHIINANLNQTKSLPHQGQEGVFRTGESFILSKYSCGSDKTGYIDTAYYQAKDDHLDLGTAMAISGAAANVGMGQSNLSGLRLLLGLLNIRLGYWALNPKMFESGGLEGNSPGGITAIREWVGMYARENRFVNLSDGGHFDNLGIYEMLKRRCKYIIVADAEADPLMRFQGLASIIRLARIDFGIGIDIDVTGIKPDKDSHLSRKHCVVGTIRYPQIYESGQEEIGYLLYCKSTLTGREPQHLHSYRIKNPTFPHQTTADQWFDEDQFEVYRELGWNVGRESLRPVEPVENNTNLEEAFNQLKQHWYPSPPGMEERSTRYANELNRIIEVIKGDPNLRFMDAQIFPEWKSLMRHTVDPLDVNLWLPDRNEEVRAGFYACSLMIQLMENVYIDLNLDDTHDHPGNRGWTNLFMHWAWSGMFRVTWTISACMFSGEFQKFCERHLRMDLGEIEAREILNEADMEFEKSAKNIFQSSPRMKEKMGTRLNPYEIIKIDKRLEDERTKAEDLPGRCYAFDLLVKNPLSEKEIKKFTFGFSLTSHAGGRAKIQYFRIQDHLRRIGLGRLALGKLIECLSAELASQYKDSSKSELLDFITLAKSSCEQGEKPEEAEERKMFAQLLTSVKTEKKQEYLEILS